MKLKFRAKIALSTVAKMNVRCLRIRMLTRLRRALRYQSRFKLLELKLMREIKRLGTFHHKSIQPSLLIKLLKEKLSLLKFQSMSSKR